MKFKLKFNKKFYYYKNVKYQNCKKILLKNFKNNTRTKISNLLLMKLNRKKN